jgi:hypothetical protein
MVYIRVKNDELFTVYRYPLFEIQVGEDDIGAVMRITKKTNGKFKPIKDGSEWCLKDTKPTENLLTNYLCNP